MCEFEKEIARMIGIQLQWVIAESRVHIHVPMQTHCRAGPPHGVTREISSRVWESRSILLPNPFKLFVHSTNTCIASISTGIHVTGISLQPFPDWLKRPRSG